MMPKQGKRVKTSAQTASVDKPDSKLLDAPDSVLQGQVEHVLPQEPEKPREMSTREKVKLMGSLTNAADNEELMALFQKLPNGDRIYDIFLEAIDKELSAIMNGKQEELPKQANNLLTAAIMANNATQQVQYMISLFAKTPLVQVLNMMNQNLGGEKFQFQEPDPEQMRQIAEQQAQARQRQSKSQQRQINEPAAPAEPSGSRGSRGAPGLGSF